MEDDNVFADKYVLLRKLGEGGMAEIFLARQLGIGGFKKELVIKRIHRDLASNESYVELFLDEARIAANLNHPNIVHIYDIGKALGTYYIAMEFIHGRDLMEICRKGVQDKQFLPLRYAVKIISAVAEGLAYAHGHRDGDGAPVGIVHRDISPTNILVSFGGLPKVVDFGIAKANTQVRNDTGAVMGKLNYMAPEQMRGEAVDGRSDLFSLGVVLYEITVGRRLFKGKGDEVVEKILHEPIPPPTLIRADYPAELEPIVMRLLEKKPENRYQDAGEVHSDLEDFLREVGWMVGAHHLSRYLAELFDVS
ncbi:MAG: serine/threonine-protein kinase, partial [bacterium]